jgi:hypothetical protein
VLLASFVGCAGDDNAATPPASVDFPEVGLAVELPGSLADLTYSVGESEEGQPTLNFSTRQLVAVAGTSCAAGARAAVSPYPLGQVVVTDETPEHVREETRENPEESPGSFLKQVRTQYLYYAAPPRESCAADARGARLQRRLTVELRWSLRTIHTAE